jgi:hypothetical protein
MLGLDHSGRCSTSMLRRRRRHTVGRSSPPTCPRTRPEGVLILDEIGFLPLEAGQASLLFEVISRRYERGSIILTSNKSYAEWAEIFSGDEVIATAMLDRLLHHAPTTTIKGQSYRLKDKQRAGLVPRRKENEAN